MESTTFSSGDDRSGWGKLDGKSKPASESEWHSIPLEEASRSKVDCSFQQIGEQWTAQQGRKLDAARGGLSKLVVCRSGDSDGAEAESLVGRPSGTTGDGVAVSLETSESFGGCKEVRLSFHGLEGPHLNTSEKLSQRTGAKKSGCSSGASLGCGYDGCLPLLPQVRAFIKGAKLSCSGLLSGDGKMLFLDSWGSLLQRSFSMRQSDTSASESELFCKDSKRLARAVSMPPLAVTPSAFSDGAAETNVAKGATAMANDLQSRADALPLAHYRPLDSVPSWKETDGQSVPVKSPVNINSKKPPKPPRHPGRTASLDSATVAAQRAAKKCRDKVSSKRKARMGSPVAGTAVTPLVALALTIGFGILMVFQGVFVQTNAAYGRDANKAFVDPAFNLRTSILAHRSALDPHPLPLPNHIDQGALGLVQTDARKFASDQGALGSAQADASKSEAILSNAFHKSMEELAWSRRSQAMPTG